MLLKSMAKFLSKLILHVQHLFKPPYSDCLMWNFSFFFSVQPENCEYGTQNITLTSTDLVWNMFYACTWTRSPESKQIIWVIVPQLTLPVRVSQRCFLKGEIPRNSALNLTPRHFIFPNCLHWSNSCKVIVALSIKWNCPSSEKTWC